MTMVSSDEESDSPRPSFSAAFHAVRKVRERLLTCSAALEEHAIPYAVIGGNAVASWVRRFDDAAERTTPNVDFLVNRTDLLRVHDALGQVGFVPADVSNSQLLVERSDPKPRRGVRLILAGEFVRATDAHPAPLLESLTRDPDGYTVIGFAALLRMKLTAFRIVDHVHLRDMLDVEGMITPAVESQLPLDLRRRLDEIKANPEERLG